jgi:hypothetical protein
LLAFHPSRASAGPPARLGVQFETTSHVPASVRTMAIDEAARLWQPYDVVVEEDSARSCDETTLRILFAEEDRAREGEGTLGEIRFGTDGQPNRLIRLYFRAIESLVTTAEVMGSHASRWPARLRTEVIGRTVGRALAHEIGHFILRWPHHAESGLMRAQQHASTLADADGHAFTLTANDELRLQIVRNAAPSFPLPPQRVRALPVTVPGAPPACAPPSAGSR